MTKPRTGIPGVRGLSGVVNESAWGTATADKRYGPSKYANGAPNPEDACYPQKLGDRNNLRDYSLYGGRGGNNVPENSWLRGGAPAESRPGYFRSKR